MLSDRHATVTSFSVDNELVGFCLGVVVEDVGSHDPLVLRYSDNCFVCLATTHIRIEIDLNSDLVVLGKEVHTIVDGTFFLFVPKVFDDDQLDFVEISIFAPSCVVGLV